MPFINLTPHEITIHTNEGELVVPPSGTVARVTTVPLAPRYFEFFHGDHGIAVNPFPQYGTVTGVPAERESDSAAYLVSLLVLGQMAGRRDVFAPDTGPASVVRDAAGRVVAVRALVAAPDVM